MQAELAAAQAQEEAEQIEHADKMAKDQTDWTIETLVGDNEATKAKLRGSQAEAARLQGERDSLQRTCDEQAEQIVDLKAKFAVLVDQSAKLLDTLPTWMLA
mgnify:CR=1 FL=1